MCIDPVNELYTVILTNRYDVQPCNMQWLLHYMIEVSRKCVASCDTASLIVASCRVFGCQGQSCPPEISYRVKHIYQEFNRIAVDEYGKSMLSS
jgi:hypothetical protein